MQTKEIKEVLELMLKYKVAEFSIGNLSVKFSPESNKIELSPVEIDEETKILEEKEIEKKRIEDEKQQFEEDNYYST